MDRKAPNLATLASFKSGFFQSDSVALLHFSFINVFLQYCDKTLDFIYQFFCCTIWTCKCNEMDRFTFFFNKTSWFERCHHDKNNSVSDCSTATKQNPNPPPISLITAERGGFLIMSLKGRAHGLSSLRPIRNKNTPHCNKCNLSLTFVLCD